MERVGSRGCRHYDRKSRTHGCEWRNRHSYQAKDFHKQSARTWEKVEEAMSKRVTCIEWRRGVAHALPPRDA
ncbi:MAG: hypothetical protein EHM59_11045 [Betaproteobacteria bacterium]|nr:MAG: hypothetical protein EHM59_11045 [Betaproteobacteria bacterium]